MPSRQIVTTPCKVNLHLGIHREKDARGYHRVDSVMAPVALFDTIVVEDAPELRVVHEPALEVAPEKTTAWKAAALLGEELGIEPNVSIHVRARIPERAGLGGSSADAGAVLRALAERWDVDPLDPRVVGVARRVGADVSFFLHPETGLYLGAGDVLVQEFPALEAVPIVLVMPRGSGASTAEVYHEFDREAEDLPSYEPLCVALATRDFSTVGSLLRNNLAPAAKRLFPECGRVEKWLLAQSGVIAGQITGSGSCSFAVCESDAVAADIAHRAEKEQDWRAWPTMTVGLAAQVC